jgi:hypothetical protein
MPSFNPDFALKYLLPVMSPVVSLSAKGAMRLLGKLLPPRFDEKKQDQRPPKYCRFVSLSKLKGISDRFACYKSENQYNEGASARVPPSPWLEHFFIL